MSTPPSPTEVLAGEVTSDAGDPPSALLLRVLSLACRAPSVHNTQPWSWDIIGERIELRAARSRQLLTTDPAARNLTISCGTALHHVVVVGAALGLATRIERLPDPGQPDLLARIWFTRTEIPFDAAVQLTAIAERCTDRRRFTSWPIPGERLEELAAGARGLGASVDPLNDPGGRLRAELLINRAMEIQRRDPEIRAEQSRWLGACAATGELPLQHPGRGSRPTRFDTEIPALPTGAIVEGTDGLILIAAAADDPLAWLQAGEALSALWLRATLSGMSVVPLSQVIEVDETRRALAHDLLGGHGEPLLIVRIGWQEIGRATLPQTPRRPLDEVLAR